MEEMRLFETVESVVVKSDRIEYKKELVVQEKPFHILLNAVEIAISMVLPEKLEEFAIGFLYAQGYVDRYSQIDSIRVCEDGSIFVYAKSIEQVNPARSIITSGCSGGTVSEEVIAGIKKRNIVECKLSLDDCTELIKETTLNGLDLTNKTHGVHIAGFMSEGKLVGYAADVGRHNAVNKIMGELLINGIIPAGALYTTGRLTSEMVAYTARIGIPILISRNAPSTLGIQIAKKSGITLISYARPGRLNIFNRADRIIF